MAEGEGCSKAPVTGQLVLAKLARKDEARGAIRIST